MKKLWAYLTIIRAVPLISIYARMPDKSRVDADLKRWGFGTGWFELHRLMSECKLYRTVFLCRLAHRSRTAYRIVKLCYRPSDSFCLDVTSGELGGGVLVCHGNSTIVFADSIGDNFLVHQNVTVGRGKTINGRSIPIIGNNVFVGAGAIIAGGINVGDNVKVGAGAVVVKDVPADCTVVGNPMRIISHKELEQQ